jgi:hypothetical protein
MRGQSRKVLGCAGLALLFASPSFAQDASIDRASLDAAAGRRVFENVLLADPQAFARRTPMNRAQSRPTVTAAPASAGDASADRAALDIGADRTALRSTAAEPAGRVARTESSQSSGRRPIRVILASPYGQ